MVETYYWIVARPSAVEGAWSYQIGTLSYFRKDSINAFLKDVGCGTWEDMKKQGYKCIKVNLVTKK
ncbi:MAG: hypothetical protein EAZ27_11790 [Cytophagales bacterium]|nr:MAG: hypothetical protein EAZ27_11790 [Cytophagales bacterium]